MSKYIFNKMKNILNRYGNYEVLDVLLFDSSQNRVYKVITDQGIFVVKEFSLDAIKNYYYLKKRKEQIRISKILNDNGINTILPIVHNKNSFILFNKHYYVVYDYSTSRPLEDKEITLNHINKLASVQSKIHKLKIDTSLTCFYHHINIDLDKQLKIVRGKDKELYNLIKDNLNGLITIINNCNLYLKEMKRNLCVSHNDYKLLNVLWKNDEMTIIDFDATGLSNPTCSLCESAFTFSRKGLEIRYDYYEEYLKGYLHNYGKIDEDFTHALYVALNGKLMFLNYMFSKNSKRENNYIEECKYMIKELLLYYNNIDKFNEIYLSSIK